MINSIQKTKKSILFLAILIFLILNCSILFAVHWSVDTPITLSGTYTRFVPKGNIVSFTANAQDRDKQTENNNYSYSFYSFTSKPNASDWRCNIPNLIEINEYSNATNSYSTTYFGRTTQNTPCGDYISTVTIDDNPSIGKTDTGSRNDPAISYKLTTTIYDMNLSYTSNATCTINNKNYPLIIRPINNDDDNNNSIEDNQENNITGENDLIPITINISPNNASAMTYLKLSISGYNIRVYANSNRSGEYILNDNSSISLNSMKGKENNRSITLYIEPQSSNIGNLTATLTSTYKDRPDAVWHSDIMSIGSITKTVYVANSGINISEYGNYNDINELNSPGMVIGKQDQLNSNSKQLSLYSSICSAITDYSITICKDNDNVKLYYYTYENYALQEVEITNNKTFNKGNIPNIFVKGFEEGSTIITTKLNIKEINNISCNLNNFHNDNILVNVVSANTSIQGLNEENEDISPGFTLGLNNTNTISFNLNNVNSSYNGYKTIISVPNNIELYTDENLTNLAQTIYTIGTDTLPKILYMKGVKASQGTLTYSLYNSSNSLIHKDSLKIDVIYCDIKVDSNNDGYIDQSYNGTEDSIEEIYPGKYIPCNTDDDNSNGIADNVETMENINNTENNYMYYIGDNEFVQLILSSPIANNYYFGQKNPYSGYKLKLSYSDNLKLYKTSAKYITEMDYNTWKMNYIDASVPNNTEYIVGTDTPPTSLYIEGISNGQGEINYTLYNINNEEIYNDKVVVTVEPIIDTIEFLTPTTDVGGVVPIRIKHTTRYAHSNGKLLVKETDEHINESDHPAVDWVEMSKWNYDSFTIESSTKNNENRTCETIYRYKWNTITTPMPNIKMGYYVNNQTHNGEHTLRYEQTIGALPKVNTDLKVNLNNLTISTDSDIIVWKGFDENNNLIDGEYPKINLTVNDNDTNDPYNVTVNIYHTGAEYSGTTNGYGQSQWTPVKTITLNNCTGPIQTITWDGSLNSGVNSQNAYSHDRYNEELEALKTNTNLYPTVPAPTLAEPWTYTYDITVTQNDTETYTFSDQSYPVIWSQTDFTHLRSDYLTINRAIDEDGNYIYEAEFVDAIYPNEEEFNEDEDYVVTEEYYSRFYNLKDSLNTNASDISVSPFNTEFESMTSTENNFNCTHAEGPCNDGCLATYSGITHEINMGIESVNGEQVAIFTLASTDNHGNLYRGHENKKSCALNCKIWKYERVINLWACGKIKDNKDYYEYFNLIDYNYIWSIFNSIGVKFNLVRYSIANFNNCLTYTEGNIKENLYPIKRPSKKQITYIDNLKQHHELKKCRHAVLGFLPEGNQNKDYAGTLTFDNAFWNFKNATSKNPALIFLNYDKLKNKFEEYKANEFQKKCFLTNVLLHELIHLTRCDIITYHCNNKNCLFYKSGSFDKLNHKISFNGNNNLPWCCSNTTKKIKSSMVISK